MKLLTRSVWFRLRRWRAAHLVLLVALLSVVITGCASTTPTRDDAGSALDPQGPVAADAANLWWLMFALGAVIFVLVVGIMLVAVLRRVRDQGAGDPDAEERSGVRWITVGGIILPLVVLGVVLAYTLRVTEALTNPEPTDLTIEVYGRRWWWEIHYPDNGVITANEIHIPVGVPVQLHLQSADVIHSFWVPQLHGKIDLNPYQRNTIQLQADEAGTYHGQCAEFCGRQHANMRIFVVAQPADVFEAWLAAQGENAEEPEDELAQQGQQVFIESECAYCHSIRGVSEGNNLGPDLTHLASRETIAAGMFDNNRGNLAGWIIDAQQLKPGSLMPTQNLTGEELQALLAYLDSLD